jgi:(1->4)-alpha-D-glucan 1-alpha-D-glucosylmutase
MSVVPSATYRLQLTPTFGFQSVEPLAEYFRDLGISHIYASPIFAARKGSTHGYDVTDPNEINAELGTVPDLERLLAALRERGIGWIQDIVPNHMAFDSQNRMLMDVLEYGPASPFSDHFDIDWNHPYESMKGKVLAPFLGKFYGECLENGEIQISLDEGGLKVNYYDLCFPLRIESYATILNANLHALEATLGKEHVDFKKFAGITSSFPTPENRTDPVKRREQIELSKSALWRLYNANGEIKEYVDLNLRRLNGQKGDPDSFNALDRLLSGQFFRLSFWKVATEEINYRRFFNINQLISVRVEDERVFRSTHALIGRLLWSGDFSGVRVDHIDGLYNPAQYLERLREIGPEGYRVVEKILQPDEDLPARWRVEGTTGYDFLNLVNGVFCERQNDNRFDRIYSQFIGRFVQYSSLVADKKRLMIGRHMAGDIDQLAHLLKRLSAKDRFARDITLYGLRRALVEVLALFPVYRTYICRQPIEEADRRFMSEAIKRARETAPALVLELDFIERFLLLDFSARLSPEEQADWIHFVMRFQQLSGPLMAKGLEDTVFYIYNKLLSLNEVGGTPNRFGTSLVEFHYFNKKRAARWPHAMSATSTHDAKRGEDVRARIDVLSELPNEWAGKVAAWHKWNTVHKASASSGEVPDKNDEYFYYQTLLGSYPFDQGEAATFVERIKSYMIKAVREAKVHTAWLKPDEGYENGFLSFIESTLTPSENNRFLQDFLLFQRKIAHYGAFNSLSQTLLKLTCPGVPDFYQGSELWDLRLVDPDNRGPVDYVKRMDALKQLKVQEESDLHVLLHELLLNKHDGRIKLFVIHRVLELRRRYQALYSAGTYSPLTVGGPHKNHVIAFARQWESRWSVTVAPRYFASLISPEELPVGNRVWEDTSIDLPEKAPTAWHNALTNKHGEGPRRLELATVCEELPIALLIGETG